MEELPAIIHKLSLRLWCPEYRTAEEEQSYQQGDTDEVAIDPLASPPQDAVDARGNVLDASEISNLTLDAGSEIHALFSQKNLLRLAALNDSHRTLSLFTPSLRDAVFRAWAGPSERGDSTGFSTPATPSLIRSHSAIGSTSTTYTFSSRSSDDGHTTSRPPLSRAHSETTGLGLGSGRHSRSLANRKRKTRVVNLRRTKASDDVSSISGDSETSSSAPASEPMPTLIPEEPEDQVPSPPRTPRSPSTKVRFQNDAQDLDDTPRRVRPSFSTPVPRSVPDPINNPTSNPALESVLHNPEPTPPIFSRQSRPSFARTSFASYADEKATTSSAPSSAPLTYMPSLEPPASILEQAWVMKMAGEIARRAVDEKAAREREGFWATSPDNTAREEREDTPPPAYEPVFNGSKY